MVPNLWLLPDLSENTLERLFQVRGLFFVLLFEQSNENIAKALQASWSLFDQQLGPNIHFLTFMKGRQKFVSAQPRLVEVEDLCFPPHYDAAVGWACREIGFGSDLLPAVVCVNGTDRAGRNGAGPPYWPLGILGPARGDLELRQLVSRAQQISEEVTTKNPDTWRDEVATRLARHGALAGLVRTYRRTPEEIKKLMRGLLHFMMSGSPSNP